MKCGMNNRVANGTIYAIIEFDRNQRRNAMTLEEIIKNEQSLADKLYDMQRSNDAKYHSELVKLLEELQKYRLSDK